MITFCISIFFILVSIVFIAVVIGKAIRTDDDKHIGIYLICAILLCAIITGMIPLLLGTVMS
jgi:hypothetical protein